MQQMRKGQRFIETSLKEQMEIHSGETYFSGYPSRHVSGTPLGLYTGYQVAYKGLLFFSSVLNTII